MQGSWWLIVPATFVAVGIVLLVSISLIWVIPWYGLLSGLFVIGLIVIWGAVIYDLLRRADVRPWQKVLWAVGVVLLPVLGVLAYYSTRPSAAKIRYQGDQLA